MSEERQRVSITDVDIPFGSLIVFLIKLAIAAIPAVLILTVLVALVAMLFGGYVALLTR